MFDSLRRLKSLTPAQRALLRAKRIEGEYSIEALVDQLTPLADFDVIADRGRAAWGKLGGTAIVIAIVSAILSFLLPLVGLPLGALAVIVAVVAFAKRRRLAQFDAANNLREVALPFLRLLAHDLPADGRLQVQIDFADTGSPAKQQRVDETPGPRGASERTTHFHSAWFAGSARLADGSTLRWQLDEALAVRERRRRNPRGKLKIKTRQTQRHRARVLLSLPRRRYVPVAAADAAVALDARHIRIHLAHKAKSTTPAPLPVDTLVDLVAAAYAKVRPHTQENPR